MLVEHARADGCRHAVAHEDGVQLGASREGVVPYGGHALRQLYLLETAAPLERLALDGLDGRGQRDVAQLGAVLEPGGSHVVELHARKPPEVGEGIDLVFLRSEPAVEPREARAADARQVDVAFPVGLVGACVGRVVIGHILQGRLDARVGKRYDAGHEAVLVSSPGGVGLEPCHLLRHHLQAGIGAVEHALADADLTGRHGVEMVRAIGHHVEQVEVGQVGAVDEGRVANRHLKV